ncbi:MAG: Na+/H+ antiporter subunit E [Spirochaetes bacterium]|nr:Na+/H+ antiporter subunit E [Spirochaetota bacterium]
MKSENKDKLLAVLFYTLVAAYSYLVLTVGSGNDILFWSYEELIFGIVISIILASVTYWLIPIKITGKLLNPFFYVGIVLYFIGPFFVALLIANLEVLYRIITGKIKPAIVKVDPEINDEMGVYLLANSITLSPGTLTIGVDPEKRKLFIHCLYWDKAKEYSAVPKDVAGFLHYFLKKLFT